MAIVLDYVEETPYAQDSAGLLAHLGAEFAKVGDLTAADDAFSRAVKAVVSIESQNDSYFNLRAIADLQKQVGRDLAARKTLSIAANVLLEEPQGVVGYAVTSQTMNLRDLAAEQRAVGDDAGAAETLAVAAELARSIEDLATRANELAAVATQQAPIDGQQQAAIGNFAVARMTIASLPDPTMRATSLASIARAEAEVGLKEPALADIQEAYSISDEIAESLDRSRLQAQIALTLLTFMTE